MVGNYSSRAGLSSGQSVILPVTNRDHDDGDDAEQARLAALEASIHGCPPSKVRATRARPTRDPQ